MRKSVKIGIGMLLAAVMLTALVAGSALAQEADNTTPAPETTTPQTPGMLGRMGISGRGGLDENALEAAAEALGMTTEELSLQLWGGETLSSLAKAKGVDLQDVQDAVSAAREEAWRNKIAELVDDGVITQENADWLFEGLEKGFLGSRGGFGMTAPGGMGRHGCRSFGIRPNSDGTNSQVNPSGTGWFGGARGGRSGTSGL